MTSQAVLLKESRFLEPTLPAKRARYHHQKNNCNLPWRQFQFNSQKRTDSAIQRCVRHC